MKLKLVEKRDEAFETKSFFWEPEKKVDYIPGQYFYFTLPSLKFPDSRGSTRDFTLSSSPSEGSLLRLTTRIRQGSGFKKSLDELPIGAVIDGEGPNGTFLLEENDPNPEVFIAGGIGITPFRSMIKYIADKDLYNRIYLIYSNTNEEDFAFRKEFTQILEAQSNIHVEFFVSSKLGHLDETKLTQIVSKWGLDFEKPSWWLCGPPGMVSAIEQSLGKLQISPGKVRIEKFTGY